MSSFNTLTNYVCSLTANAVKAVTHRFHFGSSGFGKRQTVSVPAKFFISDPALLSARGSNPDFGSPPLVNDRQNPLGLEINDISVFDQLASKWVDDFNEIIAQNHFGFDPNKMDQSRENECENGFENLLSGFFNHQETIGHEENEQYQRTACPDEVVSGSKSFIHNLSIAGDRK